MFGGAWMWGHAWETCLMWRTQISPWIGFLLAEGVWYWAETEGEPPIAWAPEGLQVEVGDLPCRLGKWEVSYAELPPNQWTGEPLFRGEAKIGKKMEGACEPP